MGNISWMQNVLSHFSFSDDLKNCSYEQLLEEMYKDLRYSIYSNAGYAISPFLDPNKKTNVQIIDAVIIERPFQIQYRESKDTTHLYVYIRGHKLSFNNFKCIHLFIDEINKGCKLMVEDLLSILDDDWTIETGLELLGAFIQNHGVRILP